ncbi:MAG: hypothetical protein ACTSRZ_18325 [Promethearchaeota archaeon]
MKFKNTIKNQLLLKDRIKGTIFGCAIGDIMGCPLEGLNPIYIKKT